MRVDFRGRPYLERKPLQGSDRPPYPVLLENRAEADCGRGRPWGITILVRQLLGYLNPSIGASTLAGDSAIQHTD
jgi:hypothetical protein